jgi:hypothetical protein
MSSSIRQVIGSAFALYGCHVTEPSIDGYGSMLLKKSLVIIGES